MFAIALVQLGGSVRRLERQLLVIGLVLAPALGCATAPASRPTTAAGLRVRVTLATLPDSVLRPENERRFEGLLRVIDSAGATIDTGGVTPRRVARADVERLQYYVGKARGQGALIGYFAGGLLGGLTLCGGSHYECMAPVLPALGGAIWGSFIGLPKWADLKFP